MKKVLIFFLLVGLTFLLMWIVGSVTFNYFESTSFKKQLKELGVYQFEENEKVVKNFSAGKRKYALSIIPQRRTMDLNIFLKNKKKYYLLKTVPSCKILDKLENIYIFDNKIYLHCDGATGVIMEYSVTEGFIGEKEYVFNFEKTPNSDTHKLTFKKVDDTSIEFRTNKIKEDEEFGDKLTCTFKKKKCKYYYKEDKNKKTKEINKTSKKKS